MYQQNRRILFCSIFAFIANFVHAEAPMTDFKALQILERCYEIMKPAQANGPDSFVWFSGIPHPLFNAVMHVRSRECNINNLIAQAPEGIPIAFWIHNQNTYPDLKIALQKRGFQHIMTCPLMEWSVKPVASSSHSRYTIKATNEAVFHTILADTFHLSNEVKERYAKILEGRGIENYLIYYDGQPVGTGTLILDKKTGGIFNISTLPDYQKKGCGRAMMEFLMNRAAHLSLETLVLFSSPVAEKLYTNLGFQKCFDIEIFALGT